MEKATGVIAGIGLFTGGASLLLAPSFTAAAWTAMAGGVTLVVLALTPAREWPVSTLVGQAPPAPLGPSAEHADWLIEEAEWATHNLLNADVSGDDEVRELREAQRDWIERVAEKMEEAGMRRSDISRFQTLNRVPDHGLPGITHEHSTLRNHISERIERLRGIAEGLEGAEPGSGAGVMSWGHPSLATGDSVSTLDEGELDGFEIDGVEAELPDAEAEVSSRENPLERAERLRIEEEQRRRREELFNSEEGVRRAREALTGLAEYLEDRAEALAESGTQVWFSQRRSSEHVYCLTTGDASFTLGWSLQWANTLRNSSLWLCEFDGRYSFETRLRRPDPSFERAFVVEFDDEGTVVWKPENGQNWYSTREFADRCLDRLIERHYARRDDHRPDLEPF